jgi:hypothetical protein
LARLFADQPLNGELDSLGERRLIDHLAGLRCDQRDNAYRGWLQHFPPDEQAAIEAGVEDAQPDKPPPTPDTSLRVATLADLAALQAVDRFVWPNWLVRGHFNLLSSDPKVGKTYLTLWLAKLIYVGLPWPDGQPSTFPEGTKTVWICGDRHQDELMAYATAFGLPLEAVLLNTSSNEPYRGWSLDDQATLDFLARVVDAEKPGLIVIDTVWRATKRKLHETGAVNEVMTPLIDIAQESNTAILGLMHLSRGEDENERRTIGRRLEGLARAILMLTKPDMSQKNRRKLCLTGNFKEPAPLGVTLRDGGCDFDSNPPNRTAPSKSGRPPTERGTAVEFLEDRLSRADREGSDLMREWKEREGKPTTLKNARNDLREAGRLTVDSSVKPEVWSLVKNGQD